MRFGRFLSAAAAASLAVTPAMAAPVNPAASLSLGNAARAGSSAQDQNDLTQVTIILLVIGVGIAGAVVYFTVDESNSDSP